MGTEDVLIENPLQQLALLGQRKTGGAGRKARYHPRDAVAVWYSRIGADGQRLEDRCAGQPEPIPFSAVRYAAWKFFKQRRHRP